MALRQKHVNGVINQKMANVTMLKSILMTIGEIQKVKADIRIAARYPTSLAKGFDNKTARLVGTRAQIRMIELVLRLTSKPLCFR